MDAFVVSRGRSIGGRRSVLDAFFVSRGRSIGGRRSGLDAMESSLDGAARGLELGVLPSDPGRGPGAGIRGASVGIGAVGRN